jgi:hypothetical protein
VFASKEQQLEGMKFVARHASLRRYSRSVKFLVGFRYMTKSQGHKRIKMFRKLKGISYDDYMRNHR